MSAFNIAKDVERVGMDALMPFMRLHAFSGQFVVTNKGPLAPMLQECGGDLLMNVGDEQTVYGIELKTESTHTGNLFLETWSNRSFTPRKVGWMLTQSADFLWYYFLDCDRLYIFNFRRLWEWAFITPSLNTRGGCGRIWDFPERTQGKYGQMNVTTGRCVPVLLLGREVGFNLYMPDTRGPEWRERHRPMREAA